MRHFISDVGNINLYHIFLEVNFSFCFLKFSDNIIWNEESEQLKFRVINFFYIKQEIRKLFET